MREKVEAWKDELLVLTRFTESQPHAAFAGFVRGLVEKLYYLYLAQFWICPMYWISTEKRTVQNKIIPVDTISASPTITMLVSKDTGCSSTDWGRRSSHTLLPEPISAPGTA